MLPPELKLSRVSDTVFGQLIVIGIGEPSAMMHNAIASEGSADSRSPYTAALQPPVLHNQARPSSGVLGCSKNGSVCSAQIW